jgi:CDP-glucose 4,6-dehydratase
MNKSFWKGKKVLITGHNGFKGSWLSSWLNLLEADLVGISIKPPSTPNLFDKLNLQSEMTSLNQDITDGPGVLEVFKKYKPEIVFHLAAQPLVRYSYMNPVETFSTNVMGSLHVLEAIKNVKSVRSAVMITTDKCYENNEWDWSYREIDPMGGHDPYSSSKGAAELLIASYRRSYFSNEGAITGVSSARAGNVIGGGDWAEDRLIPDIIRSLEKGEKPLIRNPSSIRPWQHVLEPLNGYLTIAEKMFTDQHQFSEAWNFGPKDEDAKSVEWIVNKVLSLWGNSNGFNIEKGDHPHEANYLKLDYSKSANRLYWKPKWDLAEALERIVVWHKYNGSLRDITLSQIEDYMGSG